MGKRRVIADTEGNGLLDMGDKLKLHCAVALDVRTKEKFGWRPHQMKQAVEFFTEECEEIIGHNFIDYDKRAIQRLYPKVRLPKIFDTLIAVRIVRPADTLLGPDIAMANKGKLPRQMIKAHSLDAWSHRLGAKPKNFHGPWDTFSEEMYEYMLDDADRNYDLWLWIMRQIGWEPKADGTVASYVWPSSVFDNEMFVHERMLDQTTTGLPFNRADAIGLAQRLANTQQDLETDIAEYFGAWWKPLDDQDKGHMLKGDICRHRPEFPDVTIPRVGKKGQALKPYVGPPAEWTFADAPFVRLAREHFKPGSRDHLGQRLQKDYGWKPKKFGKDGKPTVDEATLKELDTDVVPKELQAFLSNYFVVAKTRGMLAQGRGSWINLSEADGRLHHRCDTAGAITGRGTHSRPNITTVPAVLTEKQPDGSEQPIKGIAGKFGWETRDLMCAMAQEHPDWELTGTDCTALELVLAGHFAWPLDEGALSQRVSDPKRDPHTEHGELTGLNRRHTKTVTYIKLFGGGSGKVGEEVDLDDAELDELLADPVLPRLLNNLAQRMGYVPDRRGRARLVKGYRIVQQFDKKLPVFKQLSTAVQEVASQRGWLKGIDGRKLYIRKVYASLSTLIQGSGAEVCKLWIERTHRRLWAEGLRWGPPEDRWIQGTLYKAGDYLNYLWAHDEQQFGHRKGLGPVIAAASEEAIQEVGDMLKLKGRFRTAAKTGLTWAETH